MPLFSFSVGCEFAGVLGYFNRAHSARDFVYSNNGPEVTFGTTLQNRNPQMPSFESNQSQNELATHQKNLSEAS